ncbi:Plasmodium vivax Vir protein, putative [Plasmodium vivax]|nr:Plasmodium vivax Vir protein, putative [Plasmodium vivax]
MEESIFTYVNKFPEFNTIISGKEINSRGSDNGKCKSFKDVELIAYSDPNNSFTDTCKKIAEHHQEIINKAKSSQIALCKYINYWIYDTLQSMPEFSHNKLLNKFYEKIEKLDFCKPYRNSIDKRTYDELKELYNMYEPYIKFKKASSKNGNGSCEDAEKFFELYEQYAGKCKPKHNTHFCWELIKIGYISFDSWIRSSAPQAKRKKTKFAYRMHDSQDNSDMEDSRYTLAYQSSLDSESEYSI